MRGELIRAGGLPVALPHGLGRRREHLPRVEHLHQPEVRHSQHHAHDACGSVEMEGSAAWVREGKASIGAMESSGGLDKRMSAMV